MTDTASDEMIADLEEAMRDVVDPELGINVVDLGLVYGLNVEEGEAGKVAQIDMTLTSPACPLTDVIEDQTLNALVGSGLVNEVKINWVWNPPWGPDKITDDGRDQLRAWDSRSRRGRALASVDRAARGSRSLTRFSACDSRKWWTQDMRQYSQYPSGGEGGTNGQLRCGLRAFV